MGRAGEGRIDASPDHVYSMEHVGEAFTALLERRSFGTVVIAPDACAPAHFVLAR